MNGSRNIIFILTIFISMVLIGCVHVRTYTVDKKRVDQGLPKGNIGYPVDNSSTNKEANQEGRADTVP